MHKKFLSILIGLFFLTILTMPILAQETADYGFTLVRGTAGYSNGYEANALETAEPKVAYVNYIEKGKKGEVRYGDFTDVELDDYIGKGNEIDVTDGRIEILLKGGGVIRLDRNTRVVFVVLNEESIIIRVWGNNVYVEKGELEVGVKSENKELNLISEEWYLTESTKGFKKFKKWNSKRGEELKQRYLPEEANYGYDYRNYSGYGYGYPYYGGYGWGRYGGYYPYYGGYHPYSSRGYGFRRYGRYGYYPSWTGLAILVGLNILFDWNYGYYGGWYGRYYPYSYGYGYSRYGYRNYNPYSYSNYSNRGYSYNGYSRGQTAIIHKSQLSRGRNTAQSITGNISSSSHRTSFSTVGTINTGSILGSVSSKSASKSILKSTGQILPKRAKITAQERKKILKRAGTHKKKTTFSAMDYLKSRNSVKKDSYGYPSSRKVSANKPIYKPRNSVKKNSYGYPSSRKVSAKKSSSFIGRIYKNISGSNKSVKSPSSKKVSSNSSKSKSSSYSRSASKSGKVKKKNNPKK